MVKSIKTFVFATLLLAVSMIPNVAQANFGTLYKACEVNPICKSQEDLKPYVTPAFESAYLVVPAFRYNKELAFVGRQNMFRAGSSVDDALKSFFAYDYVAWRDADPHLSK